MKLAPRIVSSASHLAVCVALVGALSVAACGGSAPPPEAPPPSLEDSPPPAASDQSAKPSSKKVEQGIEALKAQDFAKAKALLSEARSESPKDPQAAFYLGVALEGLSDATGASAAYKDAVALDPVVEVPELGSGSAAHPDSRTAATQATTPVLRRDRRVRGMSRACPSDGPPDHPARVTRAPQFGVPSLATSKTGPRPPPVGTGT